MRGSIGTAAAVMALLLGGTAAATAADMSLPPLYQPEPAPMVELGSGWYLRGDLNYVDIALPGPGVSPVVDGQHAVATNAALYSDSTTRQGLFGATLGAGYQFNNTFRMDATYDWRQDISHNTRTFRSCGIDQPEYGNLIYEPNGGDCYTDDTVTTLSWTGLLNAYADIGTWSGFTPYVGAGLGMSHIQTTATENWFWSTGLPYGVGGNIYQSSSVNAPGYYHYGYPANQGPVQVRNNFSWALMAGVSYDVAPHIKIDASYRYLNMGVVSTINAAGQTVHPTVDSQEVRVGLRFTPDL